MSIDGIRKDLAEVANNPSALLFFIKELSDSVSAEDILEALIGALEDSTSLTELEEIKELYGQVEEMIRDYLDSGEKDVLLSEIQLIVMCLERPHLVKNLLKLATEELSLPETDELVQLLKHTYSGLMNSLMED
jgi:hypothetical protein